MASRNPAPTPRRTQLPDLPGNLFDEDAALYGNRPSPWRRASRTRNTPDPAPARRQAVRTRQDVVTAVAMRPEPAIAPSPRKTSSPAMSWTPRVLPAPMRIVEQAFPNLLMAVSAVAVLILGTYTPVGVPVWAVGIFIPSVLLALVSNDPVHVTRQHAAIINVATMAIIFPVLVVRQSVVRIPFVDGGNGTLLAPTIATAAVVALLVMLALACAVLSQEDPEYSGIMFLPAAMMVPLLAGQSDLVSLPSALLLAIAIFFVSALLTALASILPGAFPALIAPAVIGLEFVLLTAFQNASLFPTGAGSAAKVLFFTIVVATLALAILVPLLSVWTRQVTRFAQTQSLAQA